MDEATRLQRLKDLEVLANTLMSRDSIAFGTLKPSQLPTGQPSVYAINNESDVLYVGETINPQQRLYTNHLQGPLSTARVKKYLIRDPDFPEITDSETAKQYLKEHCSFKFLPIEGDHRRRGLVEAGLCFLLDAKYVNTDHEPNPGRRGRK